MKFAVKMLRNLISHLTLVYSVLVLFALFAHIAVPEMTYVNSTDSGVMFLCYALFAAASAVVYIGSVFRHGKKDPISSVLLPHVILVLSVTVLTLTITNFFNRSMGFVTSDLSVALMLIYATCGLFLSIGNIEYLYSECGK